MSKIKVNYDIYTKTSGSQPSCIMCSYKINDGEPRIQLILSRSRPSIHKKCMEISIAEFKSKLDLLKQEHLIKLDKMKNQKIKAKAKLEKLRDKRGWNKSIIKEALKEVGICISKISITNPHDWGTYGKGQIIKIAAKKAGSQQWDIPPYLWIILEDVNCYVVNPKDKYGYIRKGNMGYGSLKDLDKLLDFPNYKVIPLSDPNAIAKIANAMEELKEGDWSAYLKKSKRK